MNEEPLKGIKRGTPMPHLVEYLQRVVGERGRTEVTSCRRFEAWADLPWADEIAKPNPLPTGRVVLIGMRDLILGLPGPEAFIAFNADQDQLVIAAQLAESLINARGKPNDRL